MTTRIRTAVAVAAALSCLAGCAGVPGAAAGPAGQGASAPSSTRLVVFAAASLKTAFTRLGREFEAANGVTVAFDFAGSQALAEHLLEGARADVFAPADEPTMGRATGAGLVAGEPVRYASNRLVIVVPPGNPAGVTGFAGLAAPGVRLVVCAPVVPCGSAARRIETRTGTTLAPVSEEQAVTDVLAKVQAGEADAGLVYLTDARSAGGTVEAIPFPEADVAVNRNPIAVLAGADQPELAAAFVDLVTGPQGRQVLRDAGFGEP